jgi:hypothetical protein
MVVITDKRRKAENAWQVAPETRTRQLFTIDMKSDQRGPICL